MSSPTDPAAATLLARTVRRVSADRDQLVAHLLTIFAAEIAPLQHDDSLLGLLAASTDENVAAGLYVLEHDTDPRTLGAPPAALHYARRLAQRGIPVSAPLRAYRLGHAAFVEVLLSALAEDPDATTAEIAAASVLALRTSTAYVDTVSELLVDSFEQEQRTWSQHHSVVRAARIKALLDGSPVDISGTEAALGYRLGQHHVALLLWAAEVLEGPDDQLRRLERAAAAGAAAVDGQLVFHPTDEASASAWIGMATDGADVGAVVKALAAAAPDARIALGGPLPGPDGFRGSHRQATQARQVALAAGPRADPVTTFAEVGVIALLCNDLAATRAWVRDVLGGLAATDEDTERLRETVRVFLHHGSSHTAAAKLLNLHKNSVQYRIQKAETLRGRDFRDDRADVELALRAAHVLGTSVLDLAD